MVSVCGCDAAGARRGADEVAGEAWETGKVIYFFSWASQADDLSSMFTGYGFVGRPVRGVRVEWLRGRQVGVWFKSREIFFSCLRR